MIGPPLVEPLEEAPDVPEEPDVAPELPEAPPEEPDAPALPEEDAPPDDPGEPEDEARQRTGPRPPPRIGRAERREDERDREGGHERVAEQEARMERQGGVEGHQGDRDPGDGQVEDPEREGVDEDTGEEIERLLQGVGDPGARAKEGVGQGDEVRVARVVEVGVWAERFLVALASERRRRRAVEGLAGVGRGPAEEAGPGLEESGFVRPKTDGQLCFDGVLVMIP